MARPFCLAAIHVDIRHATPMNEGLLRVLRGIREAACQQLLEASLPSSAPTAAASHGPSGSAGKLD